jgi:hypothetical protein
MIQEPKCSLRGCKHYSGIKSDGIEVNERPYCPAFPDGIIEDIAFGDNKHLKKVKGQKGDIVFSGPMKKSISSIDIKSDLIKQAKDQVAFTKAIKGGKIEDYEAYINFFPNGKYLGDAQRQLSKLEDLKKSVKEKRSRKNKRKKRK